MKLRRPMNIVVKLREAERALKGVHLQERELALILGAIDRLTKRVIQCGPPSQLDSTSSYLADLSERLREIPVMYGTDGRDVDEVRRLAKMFGHREGDDYQGMFHFKGRG